MIRVRIARCSILVSLLGVLMLCPTAVAQRPRLSQHGSVSQRIGGALVTIEYNRPVARGRKLFGALVPWGRIWNP